MAVTSVFIGIYIIDTVVISQLVHKHYVVVSGHTTPSSGLESNKPRGKNYDCKKTQRISCVVSAALCSLACRVVRVISQCTQYEDSKNCYQYGRIAVMALLKPRLPSKNSAMYDRCAHSARLQSVPRFDLAG